MAVKVLSNRAEGSVKNRSYAGLHIASDKTDEGR